MKLPKLTWGEGAFVLYIVAVLWLMRGNRQAPFGMVFWHHAYRTCQNAAAKLGDAGLYCEAAYFRAVERVRT